MQGTVETSTTLENAENNHLSLINLFERISRGLLNIYIYKINYTFLEKEKKIPSQFCVTPLQSYHQAETALKIDR